MIVDYIDCICYGANRKIDPCNGPWYGLSIWVCNGPDVIGVEVPWVTSICFSNVERICKSGLWIRGSFFVLTIAWVGNSNCFPGDKGERGRGLSGKGGDGE